VKPLNILEHNDEPLVISFEEAQEHRMNRLVLRPTATDKLPDPIPNKQLNSPRLK
jgi:hypothetical protein